jgi:hypothetical protein
MVMKPAPAPPFIVTKTQFLLQFLVIPLYNPAMFGDFYQIPELSLHFSVRPNGADHWWGKVPPK